MNTFGLYCIFILNTKKHKMKKNLLTLGVLITSLSASAQIVNVIGTAATGTPNSLFYIGEGALVYSGGGVQTKGNGLIDVHGNMMIVGTSTDVVKTLATDGTTPKLNGGNIVLRLNSPATYASSTYGQLYISGIAQNSITGIVDKEYRDDSQGSFQVISIPFRSKSVLSFSQDLLKPTNFVNARNTGALAYWDNTKTVLRVVPPNSSTDDGSSLTLFGPSTFFSVGSAGWTPKPPLDAVLTIKGTPYSDLAPGMQVVLQNGGKPGGQSIDYGNGQAINEFNERYRTYMVDPFDTRWSSTYGKELYQYGNPFLTNIDLSNIGITESGNPATLPVGSKGDGMKLPIQGIRYSQKDIVFNVATGGTTNSNSYVTFAYDVNNSNIVIPTGDINNLVVKPLGEIYIKLNTNLETTFGGVAFVRDFTRNLNFNNLRRFKGTSARATNVDYSVTASKNGTSASSTVKQIGVIALDAGGVEIGRTYYVVSPNFTTGYTTDYNVQANNGYDSNNIPNPSAVFTNEEFLNGGLDPTYANQYNLYINEANENDFIHKEIPLTVGGNVSKLKFEIRENAELIPINVNTLSTGEGFWMKVNGINTQLAQGAELNIGQGNFGLYYGEPQIDGTLAVNENIKSSTLVAFDKTKSEFYAIFDKNWKRADIEIYDLSGKLISLEKGISTISNYLLKIPRDLKNAYLVVLKSDKGQVYSTKIMR